MNHAQVTGIEGESKGKKGHFYRVPVDVCETRMDILIPQSEITFFVPESDKYEPVKMDRNEFDGYKEEKDCALPVTIVLLVPITFWPPPGQKTVPEEHREKADKARNHHSMFIEFGDIPKKSTGLEIRRRKEPVEDLSKERPKVMHQGKEGRWFDARFKIYKLKLDAATRSMPSGILLKWPAQEGWAIPLPIKVFVPESPEYTPIKCTPETVTVKVKMENGRAVNMFFKGKDYYYWPPALKHQTVPEHYRDNADPKHQWRTSEASLGLGMPTPQAK